MKTFKTKSVTIFKNGTAFFTRSASVSADEEGTYRLDEEVPHALFGTLWISSPDGELKSVSSAVDTVRTKHQATSGAELIESNLGVPVEVWLEGNEKALKGTIDSVSEGIFLFASDDQRWHSVDRNDVKRVIFLEKPNQHFYKEELKQMINVNFSTGNSTHDLDLMYMQRNLGWLPNYSVELVTEDRALITLRAVVMNDAEDIEDSAMDLVVGVPNFMYSSLLSPLVDTRTSDSFLEELAKGHGGTAARGVMRNMPPPQIMSQSRFSSPPPPPPGARSDGEGLSSLGGSEHEDLYLYKLESVKLKKGERSFFDILRAESPVEHVYDVEISDRSGYGAPFGPTEDETHEVYHSVKLANQSSQPWTTGTAMVTRQHVDGIKKPISQDTMKFTPPKGETLLKLTVAPDISVLHNEKEIGRNKRVEQIAEHGFYDLVTVGAQVKVKNFKTKEISLNVRRTISGTLMPKPNDIWSVKEGKLGTLDWHREKNKANDIGCKVTLRSGEEKVIEYKYTTFVLSH